MLPLGASSPHHPGVDDFRPLSRNPHLQTIWQTLFRRSGRLEGMASETWETRDGDVIDVDLLAEKPGRPGVIVLHGLEGSSRARYVQGVVHAANARGWNAAAVNFRSCGPSVHRVPRTYHSGFTSDLAEVVTRLGAHWKSPIGLVGFSLGGNVTLKFLGERSVDSPVAAAVAVSVPFDLRACAASLDGPGAWRRIYRTRFLRTLKRKALADARRFPDGPYDVVKIRAARTIRDFDHVGTARLFGFESAEDYYARSSSAGFLAAIRTPALLLSAMDDPFIPLESIPRATIAANPALTLRLVPHGGHVGFVGGSWMRPEYVAERIAIDFLASQFPP